MGEVSTVKQAAHGNASLPGYLFLGRFARQGWREYHHVAHRGLELTVEKNQYHACCHHHEKPEIDEPGQRRHAEIERAQPKVELTARHRHDTRGKPSKGLSLPITGVTV